MGGIKMNNVLQYKGFWTKVNYEEETTGIVIKTTKY